MTGHDSHVYQFPVSHLVNQEGGYHNDNDAIHHEHGSGLSTAWGYQTPYTFVLEHWHQSSVATLQLLEPKWDRSTTAISGLQEE